MNIDRIHNKDVSYHRNPPSPTPRVSKVVRTFGPLILDEPFVHSRLLSCHVLLQGLKTLKYLSALYYHVEYRSIELGFHDCRFQYEEARRRALRSIFRALSLAKPSSGASYFSLRMMLNNVSIFHVENSYWKFVIWKNGVFVYRKIRFIRHL